MALFKRKRQYQSVDINNSNDQNPSLTNDQYNDYNDRNGPYPAAHKRMKPAPQATFFYEDEFDDGLGPDLIGDENDRQYLNSLPELEREQIIMDRHEKRQELQKRMNRLRREGRLRQRTMHDAPSNGPLPPSHHVLPESNSFGTRNLRNSSLNDLRQRRLEQKNKRKKQEENLQQEIEKRQQNFMTGSSTADIHAYQPPHMQADEQQHAPIPQQQQQQQDDSSALFIPSIQDILHITLSRTAIEAWMNEPFFEELVKNCFVKFLVGASHNGSKIYKFVEIIDLERCAEPYPLGSGSMCSFMMRVALGDHQETSTLDKVSNQPITQQEYEFWVQTNYNSKSAESRFPTREQISKKAKKLLEQHENYEAEMQRIKQLNRKYTMNDSMATLSKAAVELRIDLEQMEDNPQKEKKQSQLKEIQSLIEAKKQNMQPTHRLRKIDDKILRRNREQKSQTMHYMKKRKVKESNRSGDPFSRIESHLATSSMFHPTSTSQSEAEKKTVEIEEKKEEKKKHVEAKDIASAHDFDLDIEI